MLKAALTSQLTLLHYAAQKNLDGVTHEQSLLPPPGGGNCINWVLGHILFARGGIAGLLGGERALPHAAVETYRRGSSPLGPGSGALPLDELIELYDASQEDLLAKLQHADAALFEREVPGLFAPEPREACGVQLSSLFFHEGYHVGQLGAIRRAIGLAGAIR